MSKILEGIKSDLLSIPNTLKELFKELDVKKILLKSVPYVIFGYASNKISWLYRHESSANIFQKALDILNDFGKAFHNPLPSLYHKDMIIGVCGGIAFFLVVYYRTLNAKKFRHGVEYGSARWGTPKDIRPYMDPVFEKNVILTETERLTMSSRPRLPKYARNKNILIIGGSGSGKTRFFVKPNIMLWHQHTNTYQHWQT